MQKGVTFACINLPLQFKPAVMCEHTCICTSYMLIFCHVLLAVCRDVSHYPELSVTMSCFHWLQLFQKIIYSTSAERSCAHADSSTPLLPQLCRHCFRSNKRASVSQKPAWRHLSLLCSLPLSSLSSSILSAWWISQTPEAGIFFKAECVPCPPCELTTVLTLVFV